MFNYDLLLNRVCEHSIASISGTLVSDGETRNRLQYELDNYCNDTDKEILKGIYSKNITSAEVSRSIGISHTTVICRHNSILKHLAIPTILSRVLGVDYTVDESSDISCLKIDFVVTNGIRRAGINTIGEVVQLGRDGVTGIRTIGTIRANKLFDAIESKNYW